MYGQMGGWVGEWVDGQKKLTEEDQKISLGIRAKLEFKFKPNNHQKWYYNNFENIVARLSK